MTKEHSTTIVTTLLMIGALAEFVVAEVLIAVVFPKTSNRLCRSFQCENCKLSTTLPYSVRRLTAPMYQNIMEL
jgi:hypothetical protein